MRRPPSWLSSGSGVRVGLVGQALGQVELQQRVVQRLLARRRARRVEHELAQQHERLRPVAEQHLLEHWHRMHMTIPFAHDNPLTPLQSTACLQSTKLLPVPLQHPARRNKALTCIAARQDLGILIT